jgi:hypothetical protein
MDMVKQLHVRLLVHRVQNQALQVKCDSVAAAPIYGSGVLPVIPTSITVWDADIAVRKRILDFVLRTAVSARTGDLAQAPGSAREKSESGPAQTKLKFGPNFAAGDF